MYDLHFAGLVEPNESSVWVFAKSEAGKAFLAKFNAFRGLPANFGSNYAKGMAREMLDSAEKHAGIKCFIRPALTVPAKHRVIDEESRARAVYRAASKSEKLEMAARDSRYDT